MKMIERRPANGCARCSWWKQYQDSGWGRCTLLSDDRWFKAPPCCEYEKEPGVQDEITIWE